LIVCPTWFRVTSWAKTVATCGLSCSISA
jgi:hypothetical protein